VRFGQDGARGSGGCVTFARLACVTNAANGCEWVALGQEVVRA
jgi:hypothetical protein